jgi:hypothetical protein
LLLLILIQLLIYYTESFEKEDISFISAEWSEKCEGKNYTAQEKKEFCDNCSHGSECLWPLDMNMSINGAERIFNSGGETHCYFVIDNINYYKDNGKFFGIVEDVFFTWEILNASSQHHVEICCAIEREMLLSKLLSLNKKWKITCNEINVQPRCKG